MFNIIRKQDQRVMYSGFSSLKKALDFMKFKYNKEELKLYTVSTKKLITRMDFDKMLITNKITYLKQTKNIIYYGTVLKRKKVIKVKIVVNEYVSNIYLVA